MSKGKFGAQAAHAAILAHEISPDNWLKHVWRHAGGHYAKVVLQSDDLRNAKDYINDRGFGCMLVMDEGRTEFDADLTPTFLGVQIVDKDKLDVKNTFSAFKLYKEDSEYVIPSRLQTEMEVSGGKRPINVKDWLKERFGHGNTTQRDP